MSGLIPKQYADADDMLRVMRDADEAKDRKDAAMALTTWAERAGPEKALRQRGARKALLLQAERDEDMWVRKHCIELLARLDVGLGIEEMKALIRLQRLKEGAQQYKRSCAMTVYRWAWASDLWDEALPALQLSMRYDLAEARCAVAQAIWIQDNPTDDLAGDCIAKAFDDPDPYVRRWYAKTVCKCFLSECIALCVACMYSTPEDRRGEFINAVAHAGGRPAHIAKAQEELMLAMLSGGA